MQALSRYFTKLNADLSKETSEISVQILTIQTELETKSHKRRLMQEELETMQQQECDTVAKRVRNENQVSEINMLQQSITDEANMETETIHQETTVLLSKMNKTSSQNDSGIGLSEDDEEMDIEEAPWRNHLAKRNPLTLSPPTSPNQ